MIRPRFSRTRAHTRTWLAPLLLVAVSVALVSLYVHAYPTFSPIDEFQHVDYLYHVDAGSVPKDGDLVGQRVMRSEACRGLDAQFTLPACNTHHFRPDQFQELGQQTASPNPPTYYVMADVAARALAVGGDATGELMTRARLAGALWLSLGLLLILWGCRMLQIKDRATLPILLLLVSSASLLHSSSTVNPDSTAVLAGGLLLVSVIAWDRRRTRSAAAVFITCAFFLGALKSLFIIATGAACVFLLSRAISRRSEARHPFRSEALVAGGALVANALAVGMWLVIEHLRAPHAAPTSMGLRFHVTSLSGADVFSQVSNLLEPLAAPPLPPFMATGSMGVVTLLSSLMLAVGVYGTFMWRRTSDEIGAVTTAGAILGAVSGTLLTLLNFFALGIYIALPARYGYPLLPFMVVPAAAAAASNRRSLVFAWFIALTAVAVVGTTLLRTV